MNKNKNIFHKSTLEIIIFNLFSIPNLLLFLIMAIAFPFNFILGIILLVIALFNAFIGLFSDFRARRILKKLDKEDTISNPDFAVRGNKIRQDAVVLDGEIAVNEASVTGESMTVYKGYGKIVYKDTLVTCGSAHLRKTSNSFVDNLANKTKKIAHPISEIKRTIKILFVGISIATVLTAIFMLTTFVIQGKFNEQETTNESMMALLNHLTLIVPIGLCLLISLAFFVVTLTLVSKNIYIQDLYCSASLAEIDTICFDKTGVISDGELTIKKTIIFDGRIPEADIAQAISNVLVATDEQNAFTKALRKVYDLELTTGVKTSLNYSNENRYFGASFKGGKTFLIGQPEYMLIKNKAGVLKRCEEFTKDGCRVFVLAEGKGEIINNKYVGDLDALAMIIVIDNVRNSIPNTLKWLLENDIDIRIISGDDPLVTSTLAYDAGLKDAINYVSLENVSIRDCALLADKYTVFGKASPEQKDAIIETLRQQGKKVAMVGDGDNDILAMKRSNVAISTFSASRSAKNMSQIIINDDFNAIPNLVEQGRKLISNLQRVGSIFLAKTFFALTIAFVFMIASLTKVFEYPLTINHLLVWDLVSDIAMFALIFERHYEKNKGKFINNILLNAIPGAILLIIGVLAVFTLYLLQQNGLISWGIYNMNTAIAMSTTVFTALGMAVLYKICTPLTNYRRIVFFGAVSLAAVVSAAMSAISYATDKPCPLFNIPFMEMDGPSFLVTIILTVVLSALYVLVHNVVESFKGDDKDEN